MAMTIDEIAALLDEMDLKYEKKSDTMIFTGFRTETFRHPQGGPGVPLIIELSENGEYFKLFSPMAFQVQGEHVDAFLKACMMIQWKTKLIQFEYDADDGEIRPIVEFPIEDGRITKTQLQRCLVGIVKILDEYFPTLEQAARTGVIEFHESPEAESMRLMLELAKRIAAGESLTDAQRAQLESLLRGMGGRAPSDDEPPERL